MFYIAYTEGYDEPMPLVGPFRSFDAAVDAYYAALIRDGWEPIDDSETAHDVYLEDDSVRIGRLQESPV